MTKYVTLEQAAAAFAIQTVLSTSDCFDMLHYAIQNGWIFPSDVSPVRHGRWVSTPHKLARVCSVCNHDEPYKFSDIDADVYDYCPNCGAKMEENE